MSIHIRREGLALPVSQTLVDVLISQLGATKLKSPSAITMNFRDPNYSPTKGGYHPVEIRLTDQGSYFEFDYITDFSYQGVRGHHELVKELDFDFSCGIAQFLHGGMHRIEEAAEIFKICQDNFLHYATIGKVFKVEVSLN